MRSAHTRQRPRITNTPIPRQNGVQPHLCAIGAHTHTRAPWNSAKSASRPNNYRKLNAWRNWRLYLVSRLLCLSTVCARKCVGNVRWGVLVFSLHVPNTQKHTHVRLYTRRRPARRQSVVFSRVVVFFLRLVERDRDTLITLHGDSKTDAFGVVVDRGHFGRHWVRALAWHAWNTCGLLKLEHTICILVKCVDKKISRCANYQIWHNK